MNRYIHILYKYKVAMINSIKEDFFKLILVFGEKK